MISLDNPSRWWQKILEVCHLQQNLIPLIGKSDNFTESLLLHLSSTKNKNARRTITTWPRNLTQTSVRCPVSWPYQAGLEPWRPPSTWICIYILFLEKKYIRWFDWFRILPVWRYCTRQRRNRPHREEWCTPQGWSLHTHHTRHPRQSHCLRPRPWWLSP